MAENNKNTGVRKWRKWRQLTKQPASENGQIGLKEEYYRPTKTAKMAQKKKSIIQPSEYGKNGTPCQGGRFLCQDQSSHSPKKGGGLYMCMPAIE